ncbi:putative ATP-dependent RNA helicase DHR1, partial [Ceratobasidium sp. 392]
MAPPQRLRFNAKARNSVAGVSHKRRKRVKDAGADSNATEVVPKSVEQKEVQRAARMRQELEAQTSSKMTSKKRKRLDSYINKKLKKEERVKILAKLAASQAELPSSINLGSSATLGTGRAISHAERLEKSEDLTVRKVLDGTGSGRRKRRRLDPDVHGASDSEDDAGSRSGSEGEDENDFDIEIPEMSSNASKDTLVPNPAPAQSKPVLGSALANNGSTRVIPRKQKRGGKLSAWNPTLYNQQKATTPSQSSFDSSDSANDTQESNGDSGSEGGDDSMDGEQFESQSGSSSGSDASPDSGDDFNSEEPEPEPPKRSFKAWAQQQIDVAKGFTTSTKEHSPKPPDADPVPQAITSFRPKLARPEPGQRPGPLGAPLPLPANSLLPTSSSSSPKRPPHVTINRSEEIQAARMELPILAEEQEIVEAVLLNSVVILSGETGSGKTTQVPQFLYEAGFGVPDSELAGDLMLGKYSVVIVDEAHERGVNTDVLIGVLSRVVRLREKMWREGKEGVKPLRLIIMSATLRLTDFAQNSTLFPTPPPVISITGRQHPVTIHFDRRTQGDYIRAAETKVAKIHSRLPPGGVLVFMTGQREIVELCKRLGKRFGKVQVEKDKERVEGMGASEGVVESEEVELGDRRDDVEGEDNGNLENADEEALDSDEEEEEENRELQIDTEQSDVPMHIVPLYSLLPSDKQMKVFEPPPDGARLVVVATNVAETSLTIPGIRYVIDTGRAKERRFDPASGLQSFDISWISKASAAQRAGRAGRTGPGHCYRLYSSALYETHFPAHALPEIERMPVEGVVLQMKSMGIDAVVNFPFPTPPDREALRKAEVVLTHLGALAGPDSGLKRTGAAGTGSSIVVGGQITSLGKTMALFPVTPRFAKMLAIGRQHGCLAYVIAIAAVLSVGDPFLREEALEMADEEDEIDETEMAPEYSEIRSEELRAKEVRKSRRREFFQAIQVHSAFGKGASDVFRWLSVVGAYEFEHNQGLGSIRRGGGESATGKFCRENFAMDEIHKLRQQITHIAVSTFPETGKELNGMMKPPSEKQTKLLQQIITSGFIDQIAVRKDYVEKRTGVKRTSARGVVYQAIGVKEDTFIHPSSVLFNGPPPDFVAFQEVVRTSRAWLKDNLPNEIIIRILLFCTYRDVLAFSSACKKHHSIIYSSASLQLHIELEANGLQIAALSPDNTKDHPSLLEQLRQYRDTWLDLSLGPSREFDCGEEEMLLWELRDGVFAKSFSASSSNMGPDSMCFIPLGADGDLTRVEFGVVFSEFTMDLSQDLVVLAGIGSQEWSCGWVRLCSSATGRAHPQAKHSMLALELGFSVSNLMSFDITLEVKDELLVVKFASAEKRLYEILVFNWKTGRLLNRISCDNGIGNFVFLDNDRLVVWSACFEDERPALTALNLLVYQQISLNSFECNASDSGTFNIPMLPKLAPSFTFEFPKLHASSQVDLSGFLLRSDYGSGTNLAESTPFAHSRALTLGLTMSLILEGSFHPLRIFVDVCRLIGHLEQGKEQAISKLSWKEWGECATRWFEDNVEPNHWICWMFGSRYIPSVEEYLTVIDFHTPT